MEAFEFAALEAERAQGKRPYLEFLRKASLSMGLYVLAAGGVDPQQPHTEDEVYYIVKGKGQIRVGDEDRSVEAGAIVFVAAQVPHRFHSIEQELCILVFFAPAEYTGSNSAEAGYQNDRTC